MNIYLVKWDRGVEVDYCWTSKKAEAKKMAKDGATFQVFSGDRGEMVRLLNNYEIYPDRFNTIEAPTPLICQNCGEAVKFNDI